MITPFQYTNRLPFSPPISIRPNLCNLNERSKVTADSHSHSAPDLPRAVNFYADYSGCGHWRMIWPEMLLNCYGKVNVQGGTVMIGDKNFYKGLKTIRIQRQATKAQLEYIKWLKQIQKEFGFKIIYEIDDLIFKEDIPHYNKFRFAFEDPSIRQTSMEIMQICDEITVTNNFMKEYYIEKTGNKHITVIPNFIPKFWMDRYYNFNKIREDYQKHKTKPRVVYCGSGAHFDIENRIKQKDDFYHINDTIRKTVDKFQWVFVGGFPLTLRDLIQQKKIEYHTWTNLVDYPEYINSKNPTVFYAPLEDSNFNKAKSDLKFIESCALGIPSICQDLCTYNAAFHKFKTGDELINKIEIITKDNKKYLKEVKRARDYMKSRWMENNIRFYIELYSFPYGHPKRKNINRLNGIS
tara:strand:- start:819 stop:2045 length:1227 start_codon:yes stop_codon:yes gene_type:complete